MGREAVCASLGIGVFRASLDGELEYVEDSVRALLGSDAIAALVEAAPDEGATEACVGDARVVVRRDGDAIVGLVLLDPPPPRFEARWDNRILDRAPDGILVHQGDRIVSATPRAATLLGHRSVDRLIGEPLPAALRETSGELRLRVPGGERVVETVCVPITREGAAAELYLIRDLSEQRVLQAKLTQSDRLATVGTLAASVAHEINNPLTYVMHYIERLRRELETLDVDGDTARLARLREGADMAAEGCTRVKDIVRNLKTFGRVGGGDDVPIDVNRALRSAIQMAAHEVRAVAHLDVALGALPVVRANDGRLCQVFLNLLMNAAQAIPGDTERGEARIRVESWTDGAWVHVSIADSGSGIAPDDVPRLFEPFFSTKPAAIGTGLGLWISRDIVHELGGRIEVDTAPGRGTTMTVILPRVAEAPFHPSSNPPPPSFSQPPSIGVLRRVLVVDDEPALLELLAEALGEYADVTTAADGFEARELLEHDNEYDAILCDLMMPGMSGVELHDWVHREQPHLAPKMIFMTGAAYSRGAREFLSRVDNERLDKPFRMRDVERSIDRVIDAATSIHA